MMHFGHSRHGATEERLKSRTRLVTPSLSRTWLHLRGRRGVKDSGCVMICTVAVNSYERRPMLFPFGRSGSRHGWAEQNGKKIKS